jgi:hypothetical protein
MPSMEFEARIPVFERVKTFHAVDREKTVIGRELSTLTKFHGYLFWHGVKPSNSESM